MSLENRLLYHRTRASNDWIAPSPGLAAQDVWLDSSDGTRIHAWWCPVAGSRRALLYCHGNARNLSHRQKNITALQQTLGESVLIFDYPGFGRSEGEPSEAGCYAAAEAAYNWLVQRVPAERIILFGKSLGGGVATELAVRRPHAALVLAKTFTSVPDVAQRQVPVVPLRWLMRNRFDSLAKIDRCPSPLLIAHGEYDHLIPFAQAERLFAAAPAPKRFFVMKNCSHHGGLPPDFLAALAVFVKETVPVSAN
jgi:fermentation-respiration switch protein FrsA (DUF1100 family)